MASLDLNHIYKVYNGGVKAVSDFTMKINNKEFIVFVGPSGCGKSTTLRMIAGLEEITAGELRIDDKIVNDMQPKERNIAMVFQNYALYPHMTVYENIAYGLRIAKTPKDEIKKKVMNAAKILGIEDYLFRKPKALSGGQKQRVALGRAIVRNPKVFLLDEPLSNLDAKLRGSMRTEITKLHQQLQTTFIYVTHDQVEAMTMGTRIVVMKKGFIQQIDTPKNIFSYPVNKFVAGFIGTPQMNFYNCTMNKKDDTVKFNLDIGLTFDAKYSVLDHISTAYMDNQRKCILGIRPENIYFFDEKECKDNSNIAVFDATVNITEALGSETIIYADLDVKQNLGTKDNQITIKTIKDTDVKVGDQIKVAIDLEKIHMFDSETEQTIKPKIPANAAIKVDINKNIATFGSYKINLSPEIMKKISNGKAVIDIPSKAIIMDEGNIKAKVRSTTIIGEETLYDLEVEGNILFALTKRKLDDKKEIMISLNQAFITINQKDNKIEMLDDTVVLTGKLVKEKEKKYFYYSIDGKEINEDEEKVQKLFNAKGKKILKTELDFEISCFDFDLTKNELEGKITEVIDYGYVKLARVQLEFDSVLIAMKNPKVDEQVAFGLNLDKVKVMDHNLKIRLA
jgi:multiple sugar transport system ATP-binding protein